MRIIAMIVLAALAVEISRLALERGGQILQPVAMVCWFLLIYCGIFWFRPRA
jgi:hypothetical protein